MNPAIDRWGLRSCSISFLQRWFALQVPSRRLPDVEAKANEMGQLQRAMLYNRFHLKMHWECRSDEYTRWTSRAVV